MNTRVRVRQNGAAIAVILCVGAILLIGCESAGSGGGGGAGSNAEDGTVTVALSGAASEDGSTFGAFLYAKHEPSIYTESRMLAVNYVQIAADGTASVTLEGHDGSWGPDGTTWVGAGGTSYDLYVYTDSDDDGDGEPVTSSSAYRPVDYPMELLVDGNTTVSLDLADMVDFTGGTLDVQLDSADAYDTRSFFFGVFLPGADPDADPPVAYGEGTISSGGVRIAALNENDDGTWYGVEGQDYTIYAFIDVDGSGTDGPTGGDELREIHHTKGGASGEVLSVSYPMGFVTYIDP